MIYNIRMWIVEQKRIGHKKIANKVVARRKKCHTVRLKDRYARQCILGVTYTQNNQNTLTNVAAFNLLVWHYLFQLPNGFFAKRST